MEADDRKGAGSVPEYSRTVIAKSAVFFNRPLPDGDLLRKRKIIIGKLQHVSAAGFRFNDTCLSEIRFAPARINRMNGSRNLVRKL